MKEPEYIEGEKARKNFEEGMRAIFQVSKDAALRPKKSKKKKSKKATSERGVSRGSGGEA
jgi:hypothetical protein